MISRVRLWAQGCLVSLVLFGAPGCMFRETEDLPEPGTYAYTRLPQGLPAPQWIATFDKLAPALVACGAKGEVAMDLSYSSKGALHQVRAYPARPAPAWGPCAEKAFAGSRLDPPPTVAFILRYHYKL